MIALLLCRCSGAELVARSFLEARGVANWLAVPAYTGKVNCQEFVKQLPPGASKPDDPSALQSFLSEASRFVVVVGYDDSHLMWSNIIKGDLGSVADAEIILEQFA